MIDAHHHLWNLSAVRYPWLKEKSVMRFFGDPTAIQKNYLMNDFRADCQSHGFRGSVHIQVGAEDPMKEAKWVDGVASANPDWSMMQVVYCDLTQKQMPAKLDLFQQLPSVAGVRQILSRAPGSEAGSILLENITSPIVLENLQELSRRGLSFDLQLIPEVMEQASFLVQKVPELKIALCHAGSPHNRTADGIHSWQQSLKSVSSLFNVTCKISGLGMFDHNWKTEDFKVLVETCLEQFGAKRCMFGSNFPVDSLYSDYTRLFSALKRLVPEPFHEAIFEKTASQFYKL
ncbi:amidohydrolase family protein [Alphaproteobacteria bacterium]|nr:amidohydrolase family protein [Alphaproteobacteria bacterium]